WANLHLLFWLSLTPFITGWMGENHFAPLPTALYGAVLLCSAIAYTILQTAVIGAQGPHSNLATAVGSDLKGKLSIAAYVLAIPIDAQPDARRRSSAQKRDNALRGRFQAERPIRVGCKHLAEHVHGTHDREKRLTEPLQHCAFGFALQRRCRCGARVERDVSA